MIKMHGQTKRSWIYITKREKILHEHKSSKLWFPMYGLLIIKSFKVSTLRFHTSIPRYRILGQYFLPERMTGNFCHDFLLRCGSAD